MTMQPEQPAFKFVPDELSESAQRVQFLETINVEYLQTPAAYNPNNDLVRVRGVQFQQALPKALSQRELQDLTARVGRVGAPDDRLDSAAQVRFLTWLGDGLEGHDNTTARNAEKVLLHSLGLRGKLGALALMQRRIFSH